MLISPLKFIQYWYMRYLLITELFMVEKWERHMFHMIVSLFLIILTIFNMLILSGVSKITTGILGINEDLHSEFIT